MHSDPYRVVVVVDRHFGDKLLEVPKGVPVWIVDSPVNRAAVASAWARSPEKNHLYGVTTFKSSENLSSEQTLIGQLDTIDIHHGIYSADPPYSVLEAIGATITEDIRIDLEQYGLAVVESTEFGFRVISGASTEESPNNGAERAKKPVSYRRRSPQSKGNDRSSSLRDDNQKNKQQQVQTQIPFGNDNQRCNDNGKCNGKNKQPQIPRLRSE